MKRVLGVALGILTAIGGFLDIGDLMTNAVVGSRFGPSLGWVVVVGVIGICVFAQMSGRVAAISARATFAIFSASSATEFGRRGRSQHWCGGGIAARS
jgi:manganese transport protein